ncbi:MAG: response regulator transcription factor [Pseudolabrys sp.]|nr:response regulator transcription factor [Pseudolabrys sp.]
MTHMTDHRPDPVRLEEIASALANGVVLLDQSGRIAWMDEKMRARVNGASAQILLPSPDSRRISVDCLLSTVDVDGRPTSLCVLQETAEPKEAGSDLVAAIEAIMADTSWFTRAIVEKLKAWRQTKQPVPRVSELELLTDREREILALICEGRSDADMSRILNLSQNTIRNHVASLYRKIGVNRRSAAIIWARERAITSQEFMMVKMRRRGRRAPAGEQEANSKQVD